MFYIIKGYQFEHYKELVSNQIIFLLGGFIAGFLLILSVSFILFLQAETIFKKAATCF